MYRLLWLPVLVVAVGVGNARAQVKLEWKYPEGKKASTQAENKVKQTLTLNNMDIETSQEQFLVVESTVGKRQADGTLAVDIRVASLQAEMNLNGTKLSFSSTDPDKKSDNAELEKILQVYRAILKRQTTLVLDKDNQVRSVEFKGTPEDVDEAFKDEFDPDRLKKATADRLAVLPEEAVKKGDTWKRTGVMNLGGGQNMEFEREYKYEGTVEQDGKTLDKISVKALKVTYEQDPNAKSPAKVTKSDMKIDSSVGTILFDRERGETVVEQGKTRIKGDMKLEIAGMEFDGKVDLTIESKTTLQP